jgi:hypothetical protein
MAMLQPHNVQELEERGYTVIRNLVSRDLTARARALMDKILGAEPPPQGQLGLEECPTGDGPRARGQPGPWPAPGDERPVIAIIPPPPLSLSLSLWLYPIVTSQYSSTTLYSSFTVILSSCFSQVTIGYYPR